jgi:hypothetical protein
MEMPLASPDGARLEEVERLSIDANAPHLAAEARALCDRVRDGLFYVACVGQFKRGKSTLLNALVGQPVLPVGVVPVTAVVTVVRHGERPSARVRFAAGGWQEIATSDLYRYVTEEQNPENRKGVAAVEVFVPSELLASGMCLVDTPGIGSVFAGNTQATRAFSNRIVSDFDDRVTESRRGFELEIRAALGEVATSAESALERAKECRAQGSQAVQQEVVRLDTLGDRLTALGLTAEGAHS